MVSGDAVERHYDVHENPAFERDEDDELSVQMHLSQRIPFAQSDVESVVIKVAHDEQQPLEELEVNSIALLKSQQTFQQTFQQGF